MAQEHSNEQEQTGFGLETEFGQLSLKSSVAGLRSYQHISAHDTAWQHNGDVYNTYYNYYDAPSRESSEAKGNERCIVFPRNLVQSYVERSIDGISITEQIVSYLDVSKTKTSRPHVAVLLGMGGAGKTQIALKCCERFSEDGLVHSLFWIDVSSDHSLEKSFQDIAREIVPNSSPPSHGMMEDKQMVHNIESTVRMVCRYLETHSPWVLVFDNYDRPERIKPHGKLRTIRDYWPQQATGAVMILSRNHQCARLGKTFDVGCMSEMECAQVLQSYMDQELEGKEISYLTEVTNTLGRLALAIDQAGAYMQWRGITAEQFLHDYAAWKDDILRTVPNASVWEYIRTGDEDEQVPLSVFTTWEMSLSCISGTEDVRKQKEHFISVCGFLDPSELREDLFKNLQFHPWISPGWGNVFLAKDVWSSYQFANVIAELKGLSLLETSWRRKNNTHFTFHPLVSDWIKYRLSPARASACVTEACWLVEFSISEISPVAPEARDLDAHRLSTMHALSCCRNCSEFLEEDCLAADGQLKSAGIVFTGLLSLYGHVDDAIDILENALKWRLQQGEPWSFHYADIALACTGLLARTKQFESAVSLLTEVFEWTETVPDIPEEYILKIRKALGHYSNRIFQFENAFITLKTCLEKAIEVFGQEHNYVASCLYELTLSSKGLNKFSEAESYAKQAFSLYLALERPDDYSTLVSEVLLSRIYVIRGKYQAALDLLETHAKKWEIHFGLATSDAMQTYFDLVLVYARLERMEDAFNTINRTLEAVSLTSPQISAEAQYKLGSLHWMTGDFAKADSIFDTALALYQHAGTPLIENELACYILRLMYFGRTGQIEAGLHLWRRMRHKYEQLGKADEFIESNLSLGLYFLQHRSLGYEDAARSAMDEAVDATQRIKYDFYHKHKVANLNIAITAYADYDEALLVDKYSENLLSLWYEKCQEDEPGQTTTAELDLLETACSIRLPSPLATICDAILEIDTCRADPNYGLAPFPSYLLRHGDLENAQIAFEQLLSRDAWTAKLPQPIFTCDLCRVDEGIVAPIWHCTVCPNICFDGACYEIYKRKTEPLYNEGTSATGCLRHEFFQSPRATWIKLDENSVATGRSLRSWLQELRDKYSTSDEDFVAVFEEMEFLWPRWYFEDDGEYYTADRFARLLLWWYDESWLPKW